MFRDTLNLAGPAGKRKSKKDFDYADDFDSRDVFGIPDFNFDLKSGLRNFGAAPVNERRAINPADAEIEAIRRSSDILGDNVQRSNAEAGVFAAMGMAAGVDEGGAPMTDQQSLLIRKDNQSLSDNNKANEFQYILDGGQPTEDIYYDNIVSTLAAQNAAKPQATSTYTPTVAYTPPSYAPRADFNPGDEIMSRYQTQRDDFQKTTDALVANAVSNAEDRIDGIMDPAVMREQQTTLLDPYMPQQLTQEDIKRQSDESAARAKDLMMSFGQGDSYTNTGLDAIAAQFGYSDLFGHKDYQQAKAQGYSDDDIVEYIRQTGNANVKNKTPGEGGLLDQILAGKIDYSGMVEFDRGPDYFKGVPY